MGNNNIPHSFRHDAACMILDAQYWLVSYAAFTAVVLLPVGNLPDKHSLCNQQSLNT